MTDFREPVSAVDELFLAFNARRPGVRGATVCAALLLCAWSTSACKRSESSCGPSDDNQVIACIGGTAMTRDEVIEHLRPPQPVRGRADLPDPRPPAVEAALRVRLFAAEARRQGLKVQDGGSAAVQRVRLYRALIHKELEKRGISPAAISDDEARRIFHERPTKFNEIVGVSGRAIFVADARNAEAVFRRVNGASREAFAAAARELSSDPSAEHGGLISDLRSQAIDPALRRLGNSLRTEGEVAGPVRLGDGRYVILFADRLELAVKPFDASVATQVKNVVAHEREVAAADELYAALRKRARVRLFPAAVAALPAPKEHQ